MLFKDEPSHKRAQKINEFEKAEQLRLKQKLEEYNLKCQRRLDDLREANINAEAELEEIHQSKTDMIMKNETQKITEYESEYTALLEEWQNNLPVRKRVCSKIKFHNQIHHFRIWKQSFNWKWKNKKDFINKPQVVGLII